MRLTNGAGRYSTKSRGGPDAGEAARVGGRGEMVGRSPRFLGAVELAERFAPSILPILIVGDTGTGKELLARHIHTVSGRSGPFVDLDCGALPGDLAESLLFGHRKGAFTGAHEATTGLLEVAHRGTLFLDELGSLSLGTQRKLLRVLETGTVRRVGDPDSLSVDFRLVAAVQHDLPKLVEAGDFRFDLLHRVAGAVVDLPPLKDRGEDVVHIARHFAEGIGASLTREADAILREYTWSGNVRELRWAIQRAAVLAGPSSITPRILAQARALGPACVLNKVGIDGSARGGWELRAACRRFEGDAALIADALGIGRSTLYRRLQDEGLALRDFR